MQKSLSLVIALLALGARAVAAQNAPPASVAAKAPTVAAAARPAPTPAESEARPAKKPEGRRTAFAAPATPQPATPQATQRTGRAAAVATPVAEATPASRKLTFWERLFGRRKATPAPTTATLVTTPAATPRAGRRARPTPAVEDASAVAKKTDLAKPPKTKPADEKPEAEKPAPVVAAKTPDVSPKVEPESPATPPVPAATPSPVRKTGKTRGTAEAKNIPPPKGADEEVQEKYKYDMAKAKALTDPAVLKLKEKAESAVDEDEGRKAQRAYTKALFNKMRSIDGSIKERADRIEAGIMRRLESSE